MLTRGDAAPEVWLPGVDGCSRRPVRIPGGEGAASLIAFAPAERLHPGRVADLGFLGLQGGLRVRLVADETCEEYARLASASGQPWYVPVLSDVDGHAAAAYDVEYAGPEDTTAGFLVDTDGSVRRVWRDAAGPSTLLRPVHRTHSRYETE
jgi:hypothetical protein